MPPAALTATFILNKTRKDRLESVRELNAWGQVRLAWIAGVSRARYLIRSDQTSTVKTAPTLACEQWRMHRTASTCHPLQDVEDLSILSETPSIKVLALACNNIRSLK